MRLVKPQEIESWKGRAVDVRNLDEFAAERVAGLKCVPLDRLVNAAGAWDPEESVLLLCKSGARATRGAQQLEQVGFRDVRVVEGGIEACSKAGLNIVRERRVLPLQRQVLLSAGVVMLTGLGLSLVNPWFLAIDWFAASMLVVAGTFGFCPMAKILQVMPWNKVSGSDGCASGSCTTGQ